MTEQAVTSAEQIIKNHAWFSALPGFWPVPLVDIVTITAVQLDMVKKLCKLYGCEYSEERGKSITTALISTTLGRIPGYAAKSLFKAIPGVGWVLGGISMAAFAGASTWATGMVFKEHFDQGGTLHDLNPENFKKFYKEQQDKAKTLLDDWLRIK